MDLSPAPVNRFDHGFFACLLTVGLGLPTWLGADQTDDFTDGKPASSVLGQVSLFTLDGANRGGSPAAHTLSALQSVAVDSLTGKVFVTDTGNRRVLRYSSSEALPNGPPRRRSWDSRTSPSPRA